MTIENNNKKSITITRIFDAPRELVFKAWTDPAQFIRWFGTPPVTVPASKVAMDVRPGGKWHATMVSDTDGSELPFLGVYREVVPPERLVFAMENPSDPNDPNIELVTVTFADLDGKTEMVFQQAGHLPEEVYATGLKDGWTGFFNRLTEHLATV